MHPNITATGFKSRITFNCVHQLQKLLYIPFFLNHGKSSLKTTRVKSIVTCHRWNQMRLKQCLNCDGSKILVFGKTQINRHMNFVSHDQVL